MGMSEEVGIGIEPIVAYRQWNVLNPYFLVNANYHDVWLPGERFEAECRNERRPEEHESPAVDCTCGIYASKLPDFEYGLPVSGEVYLWGRVLEYSQGYRAQYAYPKSLKIRVESGSEGLLPVLSGAYGVPVELWKPEVRGHGTVLTPSVPKQRSLSLKEMVTVALTEKAPLQLRRHCRTQASLRLKSSLASYEKTKLRLEDALHDQRYKIAKTEQALEAMVKLKAELHR